MGGGERGHQQIPTHGRQDDSRQTVAFSARACPPDYLALGTVWLFTLIEMLVPATLRAIATARLQDAEALLANARYDGARYICGYAVELTLKARICDTLNWPGYPEKPHEFQYLQSFKVHNLEILLLLSGRASFIKQNNLHLADWSIVNKWDPESRYRAVGTVSPSGAQAFLLSSTALMPLL